MDLTKTERLILFNQYEILKGLCQADDSYMIEGYEANQEILTFGYKHNYGDLFLGFDEEMPESISNFVIEILQMHRVLLDSYNKLSSEEKKDINLDNITYRGFDANEESSYYSYSIFFLEKLKRYPEIYKEGKGILNSHCNILDRYENMVAKWKKIKGYEFGTLTKDQILQIIK